MHVEIPFTYEALARMPGSKRDRMVTLRDRISCEVDEAGSNDVSPVATVQQALRHGRGTLQFPTTSISNGEGVLEPVGLIVDDAVVVVGIENYDDLLDRHASALTNAAWGATQHLAAAFAIDDPSTLSIVTSFRASAVAAVETMARRSLFVDGRLHVPGSEPVYVVDELRSVRARRLTDARRSLPPNRIWRADAEDVLLDHLARLPPDKADKVFDQNAISVHRPDLLTWDRDVEILKGQVARLVRSIHRSLTELPLEAVVQWVSLRDLASRGATPSELALAVDRMAEHCPAACGAAMKAARPYLASEAPRPVQAA